MESGSKTNKRATVRHADLWGLREIYDSGPGGEQKLAGGKYQFLSENNVTTTEWEKLDPQSCDYLFVPQNVELKIEYEKGVKITDLMPVYSVGIVTARDSLTIHFTPDEVWKTVNEFISLPVEEARARFNLGKDADDWKIHLAQNDIKASGPDRKNIVPILYRPFDRRWTYYTGRSRGFICRPRSEVMSNFSLIKNIGISTTRSIEIERGWEHIFCTKDVIQHHTVSLKEVNYVFPLYLNPAISRKKSVFTNEADDIFINLKHSILNILEDKIKLNIVWSGRGDLISTFGPESVIDYIYAILHCPTYRTRYSEFLKREFPRLPLTSDKALFRDLCALSARLTALHLMEADIQLITQYPEPGDNAVEKVRYDEIGERVYINKKQYFSGVPRRVWEFHVGGYQVCEKWLKDRKGRKLTYDDLTHYQRVLSAIEETIRIMEQIDERIPGWPIE